MGEAGTQLFTFISKVIAYFWSLAMYCVQVLQFAIKVPSKLLAPLFFVSCSVHRLHALYVPFPSDAIRIQPYFCRPVTALPL